MLFRHVPIVVRGGGDLASGVIYRLAKAGFPVIVTELSRPLVIRRAVAFASAVFEREITIEGLCAILVPDASTALVAANKGKVPVVVDDRGTLVSEFKPPAVVDARIAKRNLDTSIHDAPLVIALGPGYEAGVDCHAVIETNRGHFLGRVLWQGSAEPNTGQPGAVRGRVSERVLRAPADGYVVPQAAIGDMVVQGAVIATVEGEAIRAPFDGVLRGLIHSSVPVTRGLKIGDVDPRGVREHCFSISEKALAVGGGVVEAVLTALQSESSLKHKRDTTP